MSLYSHSAHSKFSMPWSHWPTSSPVMVSSPPHKRQVTSCQSLQVALAFAERLRRCSKCRRISVIVIWFFILFLSLTRNSLSDFWVKVKLFFNFFFTFFSWHKCLADWFLACDEGMLYRHELSRDKLSSCFSLTHWIKYSTKLRESQPLNTFFFTFFCCCKSLSIKGLGPGPWALS